MRVSKVKIKGNVTSGQNEKEECEQMRVYGKGKNSQEGGRDKREEVNGGWNMGKRYKETQQEIQMVKKDGKVEEGQKEKKGRREN